MWLSGVPQFILVHLVTENIGENYYMENSILPLMEYITLKILLILFRKL